MSTSRQAAHAPTPDMSTTSRQPVVDVIVPVYNGAATIESALGSLQVQTLRDIRIIVIDDGSSDGTRHVVERLAAMDQRIVLKTQDNRGLVDTLNAGLSMCAAEFVARLDADDLADADRLERQIAFLKHNPGCVAVSGSVRHIDECGRIVLPIFRFPSPDLADADAHPQIEPYLLHPFLMMRRAAAEQVGGYRHALLAEDTDLYWRLQEVGGLTNMPDLLGSYRISAASVTGNSILNGRVSALNSQLAGISTRRRRTGRRDITFADSAMAQYRRARSLEGIVGAGSGQLDAEESERLAACTCAKLLELASYRPYELEAEDCAFIRRTLSSALPGMSAASRRNCIRMMSGTTARLAAGGKLSAALQLSPASQYPLVAARLMLRLSMPDRVRKSVLRAFGRAAFAK